MRTTFNTWRPDTCKCVLQIEFDADEAVETRQHKFSILKACEHHENVPPGKVEEVILEGENRLKNNCINDLVEDGLLTHDNAAWTFGSDRKLRITMPQNNRGRAIAKLRSKGRDETKVEFI